METSAELLEKVNSGASATLNKISSDSKIYLKRLSVASDDDETKNDLELIGWRISLAADQDHSGDRRKSKSTSSIKVTQNSKQMQTLNNQSTAQEEETIQRKTDVDDTDNLMEMSPVNSIFQVELWKNDNFELQIKSKSDYKGSRSWYAEDMACDSDCEYEEDQSVHDEESLLMNVIEDDNYFEDSNFTRDNATMSTMGIQTDNEIGSSSAQTDDTEILGNQKTEDVVTQTDRRCDASTSTDEKEVESVQTETEMTLTWPILSNETVTVSSQTETAAFFSIDRVHDTSTKTNTVSDTDTTMDFVIHTTERKNASSDEVDKQQSPCFNANGEDNEEEFQDEKLAADEDNEGGSSCEQIQSDKGCPPYKSEEIQHIPHQLCIGQISIAFPCMTAGCDQYKNPNDNKISSHSQTSCKGVKGKRPSVGKGANVCFQAETFKILSDSFQTRSVVGNSTLPSESHSDERSHVCVCNVCHSSIQNTDENTQNATQQFPSLTPVAKNKPKEAGSESEKFPVTTSPSWKSIDFNTACETVNNHILCLRPVDEERLKISAELLQRRWFDTAGTKNSNANEVRSYLRYFEEFSYNLLKTLLHSVDSNGNSALHFAYANNRFDLVEEFLSSGYATELLSKSNKLGNSPLMLCAITEPKTEYDWNVIRKSFEMRDVNLRSSETGQTPMMNAVACGFLDMVELLLDAGADPNIQDKDGSTALMYAAEHGHVECIKILLQQKQCDPTITDTDNQTACSIAMNNGHENIAVLIHEKALEKRRLRENLCTEKGDSFTGLENAIPSAASKQIS